MGVVIGVAARAALCCSIVPPSYRFVAGPDRGLRNVPLNVPLTCRRRAWLCQLPCQTMGRRRRGSPQAKEGF